jgi:hypothetical protein
LTLANHRCDSGTMALDRAGPAGYVFVLIASLALGPACQRNATTAIRVEIDRGDLDLATAGITQIHVRTYDTNAPAATISQHDFNLGPGTTLPLSLSIVPRDETRPSMNVGIEIEAPRIGGRPPLFVRAETAFQRGVILALAVALSEACAGRDACDVHETCDRAGACVSAHRDLPAWRTSPADADVAAMDVPPPPRDVVTRTACTMPASVVGYYCPVGMDWICAPNPFPMTVGAMPPPGGPQCCLVTPGASTCAGVTCPSGLVCGLDPMGHAACCSAASMSP